MTCGDWNFRFKGEAALQSVLGSLSRTGGKGCDGAARGGLYLRRRQKRRPLIGDDPPLMGPARKAELRQGQGVADVDEGDGSAVALLSEVHQRIALARSQAHGGQPLILR